MQNLCSNSSSECVLSKTFRPHPEIPYRSKVIAETVTEGDFSTHFICRWFITRYRTNISKPNSRANHWTTIFTPLHRHKIGICFLGNSVEHIQRQITLLISNEIMQNLCSNSISECVISKTFRRHPKIPCRSKVIVETVTEDHFSTHFLSDYGSWITIH